MSSARKLGLAAAALVTFGVGAAELLIPRGPAMTAFGDLLPLALLTAVTLAFFRNSFLQKRSRIFWLLMGFGCMLWTINTAVWAYYEIILKQELPEPCFGDVILFIHVVPFMAAVALRPHRPLQDRRALLDAINFLMLLIWWVFLYAFIVFPDQYVILNVSVYSRNYDLLYLIENLLLVL